MRQSHLILSNAVIMWASRLLLLVPQLVLVPYLIATIGEDGYGVYALIWALIASVDHLVVSLQSGVIKYSAGFLSQGRVHDVNKAVSSSFVYCVGLALCACIVIALSAGIYHGEAPGMRLALFVVAGLALLMIPLTPYIGVIQSTQRYYVNAVAQTLATYVALGLIYIWFNLVGPSVQSLILIMTATLLLSRLGQVPIAYRVVPGLRNRFGLFDVTSFRSIAAFGGAVVLIGVCLAANSTGIRWLMNSLVSASFVAKLVIMLMPSLLLSQIVGAMTLVVMPAASSYDATGNQQMLKGLLLRGTRYTTILIIAAIIVAVLLMRNVLTLWVGPEYGFLAPYAVGLFVARSCMLSCGVSHLILKGLGRLRVLVATYAFGLVLLPIAIIFAVTAAGGNSYIAVAAGLSVGYVVCGLIQLAYCMSVVRVGVRSLVTLSFLQPLIVGVVVIAPIVAIATLGGLDGVGQRAGIAGAACAIFCAGCYVIIATAGERQQSRLLVRAVKRKYARFLRVT